MTSWQNSSPTRSMVVLVLKSDPHHFIANFPPTIETIQDEVLHALRSYGFQKHCRCVCVLSLGKALAARRGDRAGQFVGNGFPADEMKRTLEWNRHADAIQWQG